MKIKNPLVKIRYACLFVVGNQAVISRKDVRLKIDCRIINQCSRADVSGRAIFHHKLTNSIFLILPVITFRTINVDVAAARSPFSGSSRSKYNTQVIISISHFFNADTGLFSRIRSQVFQNNIVASYKFGRKPSPFGMGFVCISTYNLSMICIVYKQLTSFRNIKIIIIKIYSNGVFCLYL